MIVREPASSSSLLASIVQGATTLIANVLIAAVRCYQLILRPILPSVCRFQPSCSEYFILAVQKYGPLRGGWRGVGRLCRCHPFHRGGYDPP
jgi:putative membrane protein insertion efficiency factor